MKFPALVHIIIVLIAITGILGVDNGLAADNSASALPKFGDPRYRPDNPGKPIKSIRFLTGTDFPPFNYIQSDGRLGGFHVELARSICRVLTAICSIEARPFTELRDRLAKKEGDAILAGLAVTAAGRKTLSFTNSYLRLPARFVAKSSGDKDPAGGNLDGKWISVIAGSAHQAFAAIYFPNAKFAFYTDAAAARAAVRDGDVDLHFGDGLSLAFWLTGESSKACCRFVGGPYMDEKYFGAGLAAATRREDEVLVSALNFALAELQSNGRISELYLRYFPMNFY